MQKSSSRIILSFLLAIVMIFNTIPISFANGQNFETIKEEETDLNSESNSAKKSQLNIDEDSIDKNKQEDITKETDESFIDVKESTKEEENSIINKNHGLINSEANLAKEQAKLSEINNLDNLEPIAPKNVDSLIDNPIGDDWILGDFIYDANKVIGFSESGLEKVKTHKDLILPHINPETGQFINTVGENEDSSSWFHNKGLTSVRDFNGNITIIEGHGSNRVSGSRSSGVFLNNNITEVNLLNLESIGSYAFMKNSITKLNFPKLKTIGSHAFSDNRITSIEEEDLPLAETAEDLSFAGNSLKKIHMPSLIKTGEATFFMVGLEDAYFPKLEIAGVTAFRENNLTEVSTNNFPALKYIELAAFYGNKILNIDLPKVIRLEDAFINSSKDINPDLKVKDNFESLEEVGVNGLYGLNLTELNIPNLKKVGDYAFSGNPGVSEDVYNGLYKGKVIIWTSTSDNASKENYLINPNLDPDFEGDWNEEDFVWDEDNSSKVKGFSPQGLYKYERRKNDADNPDASIVLPERATIVGKGAFKQLGIESIEGKNVEIIESEAFASNKLTNINDSFPKLEDIVGAGAFESNKLTEINLPLLKNIPAYTFNKNSITKVSVVEAETIGDFAFADATYRTGGEKGSKVEELIAPKVKSIGKGAFMNHNLTSLDLPMVEIIGPFAFSNPNSRSANSFMYDYSGTYDSRITGYKSRTIKTLNLPKVKEIDFLAFAGNVVEILKAPLVEKIGRRAFEANKISKLDIKNIVSIDTKAFKDNKIDEVFVGPNTTEINNDSFSGNRSYNTNKREVFILLPNHENQNNLQDGIVNGVRQHVINPTKVTIKYVDNDGNEIFGGFSEYILQDKIYDAISDVRYKVDEQTKTATDDRTEKTIEFVYEKRPDVENTEGIEIRQDNEIYGNDGSKKERYHIGDTMTTKLYMDLTGIEKSYSKGKINIYYDYRYIDDSSVEVVVEGAEGIKKYQAHNGVIEIDLDTISGGYQLETTIKYKFNKYVTPNNYRMEINTVFNNDGEILSTAKPIYLEGYYNTPKLSKGSPLNLPDYDYGSMSSTSNGPRFMGILEKYITKDNKYAYKVIEATPVAYSFLVEKLERDVDSVVVEDKLPTYIAVKEDGSEEERIAVFDPNLNPNWAYDADTQTVTYSKSFESTHYVLRQIDPLYLTFPDIKSGTNVKNTASMKLTPSNMGAREDIIDVGEDDLTIYTGKYQNTTDEGDPRFSKEVASPRYSQGDYRAFFYDIQSDREKVIPFRLRASSMASLTDLTDVTLTDYDLDERLYYYGISFPKDDHTAGNMEVNVIAYKQVGTKMNPLGDNKLYEEKVVMSKDNSVVFPENIAKSIDYLQIILPKNHKLMSAVEVQIDTKLREPDKSQFITKAMSGSNIFLNYAVMSGNLYQKNTDNIVSKRTDPIKDSEGVNISTYTEKWDNIDGTYLWGEKAEIQIRDYAAQVGLEKRQTFSTSRAIKPGESGTYSLRLTPRIYSSNGTPQYNVELLEDLKNFELIDLMPKGMEIVNIVPTDKFVESNGKYEIVANYGDTGRTAIIFKTELLEKGIYDIAKIETKVGIDAPEGFLTNEAYVTFDTEKDTDGKEKIEKYGVKETPVGVDDSRIWLKDTTSIRIIKAKEMVARKYIRNIGDLAWSETGIITPSEGEFEYKLSLINNLADPRTEVSVVDFFPYVDDISIQEENIGSKIRPERGSEFENSFDISKQIKLFDGYGKDISDNYNISYWNSDDIIDYKEKSADEIIANLTWEENPSTNTRAIRVVAKEGVRIASNDKLDIIVPMKAPKNDISNNFDLTGKKAWNSFVRDDAQTIRFVETNKVYNTIPEPVGSIEFNKFASEGIINGEIKSLENAKFQLVKIAEEGGEILEEIIDTQISNQQGTIKFNNINILDNYIIREVETNEIIPGYNPGKYKLSTNEYKINYEMFKKHYEESNNFDLEIDDEKSQELFLNIKPYYGKITIEKVNGNGEPMQYIRFALKDKNSPTQEYIRNELTDANGKIIFDNIIEGSYELIELPVKAGVKVGHTTSYVPIKPIDIVINKEHTEYNFTGDEKIVNDNLQLLINKVGVKSLDDIPSQEYIHKFTNIGKVALKGFKFKIVEVENPENVIFSGETDEKGNIIVSGLKANVFYEISEIEREDDKYLINPIKYKFKINKKTQILDEDGNLFIQSSFNFANAEKTEISGKKTWNDNENQDGIRPESITIKLLANGNVIDTKKVTLQDGWKWTFTNLPKYANGEEIVYTIIEDKVEGYTATYENFDVENTYTPRKTSIDVIKVWEDSNNRDGIRPQNVTIKLLANCKDTGKTVELSKENNWKASFIDLDEYEEGNKINYTIEEVEVRGYKAEVTGNSIKGYTVTNIHTPEKTEVSGIKTWKDKNNQDGKRPESITIRLLADGVEVDSKTVSKKNDWKWTFENLDKFKDGKEIVYTITEDKVEGYTSEIKGYDVINTYIPTKPNPRTGDNMNIALYVGIGIVSLALLYFVTKKNKQK